MKITFNKKEPSNIIEGGTTLEIYKVVASGNFDFDKYPDGWLEITSENGGGEVVFDDFFSQQQANVRVLKIERKIKVKGRVTITAKFSNSETDFIFSVTYDWLSR